MQNPELVTADDLNSWADNDARDAQENFPRLVRRLLQETPGVSGVSVRAGNGVSQPGYDGVAQSDGTASVLPRGSLVFEFGTSENVQKRRRRIIESGPRTLMSVAVFSFSRRLDAGAIRTNGWQNVETKTSSPKYGCWMLTIWRGGWKPLRPLITGYLSTLVGNQVTRKRLSTGGRIFKKLLSRSCLSVCLLLDERRLGKTS